MPQLLLEPCVNEFLAGMKQPSRVEEIPLCSRGVSDRRVASPGPVFTSDGGIRRQPCERYAPNPSCIYLALRHGPPQHFRSPKGRATPSRNVRNINSIWRLWVWYIIFWQPQIRCSLPCWRGWAVWRSVQWGARILSYSISLAVTNQLTVRFTRWISASYTVQNKQ